MADEMETKRIINLPAESAPADGDVFVIDNEATGTKKLPITGLIDRTLTQSGQAADAAEVGKIADDLKDYNCADILSKYVPKASTTSFDVTYTWDGDACYVSGTSTGISQHNIIADPVGLGGLEEGKTYHVKYSGTDVMLVVYFYDSTNYGGTQTRYIYYDDAVFTVPVGSKSTIVRLRVNSGKTVDEHVEPHLLTAESNEELGERIDDLDRTGVDSGSGNPLVLNGTADDYFDSIAVSAGTPTVKCFGKNLAQFLNPESTSLVRNGVTFTFDPDAGSIRIRSETGASADTVSGNFTTTINGTSNSFNYKLHVKEACYVTISPNCEQLQAYVGDSGNVTMQIWHLLNGANYAQRIKEKNFTIPVQEGEDIGVRFYVRSGWQGDLTFYPQIEIGTHATGFEPARCVESSDLTVLKSKNGVTTLICDDDVTITATAKKRTTKESALNADTMASGFNTAIAGRVSNLYKRYKLSTKPIITFIDDDTSSVALVTRYYNVLHGVGAVGNYAVITNTMLANEGEKDLLLSYEKQGFGCLYHCSAQGGAQESSPGACYLPQFRDMEAAEDNFLTGLRAMQEAGFSAYKYWVSPYGVDDAEILTIPRRHGMECLITMGQFGHISPANCDRWHIPRWHLSPAEFSARGLNSFKQIVDACVADYGWFIVVTHCNEWDATTTMDTALADAAQYAIDAGMDVRNFPDAFEIFKPFFYANEMF